MYYSFLHIGDDELILPAADNDFVFGGTVPDAWTLARASTALGRGSNGRWTSYAVDAARPHYHPVTLQNQGLLIEPTRTQLIYSSRPLLVTAKNVAITADTTTQTPFGLGATRFADNATNASHGFDLFFGVANRAAAIPDGSTVSLQMTFKPFGGLTRGAVFAQVKNGVYKTCEFSVASNPPTIVAHSMLAATISPDTDGFYRLEFTLNYGTGTVTTGSANVTFAQDDGNRTYIGDGTKGFLIAHYGAEIGPECTSPIITTGASIARSEDILTSAAPWLKVGEKSFGIDYTPLGADPQVILHAAGGDEIEFRNSPGLAAYSLTTNGTSVGFLTGSAPAAGIERTNVLTAAFNLFWIAQDGKLLAFDEDGYAPNALTSIRIGSRVTGGFAGPMLLRRIKHWTQGLDREAAAAFSADLSITGIAPVLPVIDIQSSRTVLPEESAVSLTVTLAGEPSGAKVNYVTINGTAIAGTDYTAVNGTLEFAPGQSVVQIPITLGTRSLQETRTFSLKLSAPAGAVLGGSECVISLTKATPTAHAPLKLVTFDGPLSADWSLTRSTQGYTRGPDGLWVQVPINQARIHYSAAGDYGILLEPATEQCLFESAQFGYTGLSTITNDNATQTPTGLRSMKWRETATTGSHLFRAFWNAAAATWPTGDYTIWALVKPVGTRTRYKFSAKGIDSVWKTATFTLSGAGSVVATSGADVIAMVEQEPFWPGWYRLGIARPQAVTANVSAEFDIGPLDPTTNSTSLVGDVNNGLDICHFQVEAGLFWSSPIPVQAATAKTARAADVLKAAGTWHKRQSFALGVKFKRNSVLPSSQRVVQFRDGAPAVDDYGILTVDRVIRAPLTTGSTFHGNINGPANPDGQWSIALMSIDTTRYAMWTGGTLAGEISMAGKTLPEIVDVMRFGSLDQDGTQGAPIVVQSVAYWTVGLSNEEGAVFSANFSGTPPGQVEPDLLPMINVPATLSVQEGSAIQIPVTKVGAGACSVNFVTKSQTASFGTDYTGVGSTDPASPNARIVSFAENESTKFVSVQTVADTVTDPGEKFGYSISTFASPANCTLGNAVGVCTIMETAQPVDAALYSRDYGFATHTRCGEGREWYKVTNLDDSGAGSLRDALSASNRNIVFEVGGTIVLADHIKGTINNVSVLGETAPYPGIIIQKYELQVRGSNQRYTHLTLERGYDGSDYGVDNGDCVKINSGNGSNNWTRSSIHFDHCLFLWAQDETVQIWPWESILSDISFSNCYFAEALWKPQDLGYRAHVKVEKDPKTTPQHNFGLIIGFGTKKVDVQNCVFADMDWRFPFIDHSTSVVVANTIGFNNTKGATVQQNRDPLPKEKALITCRGYLCISGPQSTAHSGFRFHSTAGTGNGTTFGSYMYAGTRVCVSNLYGWKGGSATSTYITPGTSVEYGFGTPKCSEGGKDVAVETSTPPIDIPDHPVSARSADDIYTRAKNNCGPFPKNRFGHAQRVIDKLSAKAGQWINHESEVGGRSAYKKTTRKLDGTTKFDDGTTIAAPPTVSATATATEIAAVAAWVNEFRKRIQHDFD